MTKPSPIAVALAYSLAFGSLALAAAGLDATAWKVGTPIVSYWCGPAMADAAAQQLVEGGWNVVWCNEKDLDLVRRYGLRGQLTDPLLTAASLDDPAARAKLDDLIARVRHHPALYSYFLRDEPNAADFAALGRLTAYLREHDPAHLAYINLFPTYATNAQLGNQGDRVTAYQEHLQQFLDRVHPALISYDHYQFTSRGDTDQYFLNLALIRSAAQRAGLPFLNIVQSCSWAPSMRVPTGDELRYLVYTTLAYGAEGISYYVYSCPGHKGGIANADGTPTPLFESLKILNREFVAIATELQTRASIGVYHAGMTPLPAGAEPLPANARLVLDPAPAPAAYQPPAPVTGVVLGFFGPRRHGSTASKPTHVLVVNLNYKAGVAVNVRATSRLKVFDPATRRWSGSLGRHTELHLLPGGGQLLRL